jgi:hypothetical protein
MAPLAPVAACRGHLLPRHRTPELCLKNPTSNPPRAIASLRSFTPYDCFVASSLRFVHRRSHILAAGSSSERLPAPPPPSIRVELCSMHLMPHSPEGVGSSPGPGRPIYETVLANPGGSRLAPTRIWFLDGLTQSRDCSSSPINYELDLFPHGPVRPRSPSPPLSSSIANPPAPLLPAPPQTPDISTAPPRASEPMPRCRSSSTVCPIRTAF